MPLTRAAIAQAFLWRGAPVRCPVSGSLIHGVEDAGILGLAGVAPGLCMPYLVHRSCLASGELQGLLHGPLMASVDLRVRTMPADFAFPLSVPPVPARGFPEGFTSADAFRAGLRCRADARSKNPDIDLCCCGSCRSPIEPDDASFLFGVVRQLHPTVEVTPGLMCWGCAKAGDFLSIEGDIEQLLFPFRWNPGGVFPSLPSS